jgi:hypothetical protein
MWKTRQKPDKNDIDPLSGGLSDNPTTPTGPIVGGQPTNQPRPNRYKAPPIAPANLANPSKLTRGQPIGPTNPAPINQPGTNKQSGIKPQPQQTNPGQSTPPNQPGPNPRPNNCPIAGGQPTRKRANQPTRANPQQNPNNPANGLLK